MSDMLQNKLSFNQSSVSLEIFGLPDYSSDENKDQISIISQWKLLIINKPLIEGNIDHLSSIMNAFYVYSNFLINDENAIYESNLIDIRTDNLITHNILLKSSKPNVKPLNINIGNSVLSDIINCFDQLNSSKNIKKINSNVINDFPKKKYFTLTNKTKFTNILLPPIISLCSIFLVSYSLVYLYDVRETNEKSSFINSINFSVAINI
tara:strand:- start:542 stop:1165 length:624 start_codon:yes stop_codon:yes gene_type:complete